MSPGGGRPFWKRSERGTARRQHSQQRRARSRVLPRARRLRRPLPLRPSCGGPGGGGSCYRRRCRLSTHSRLRSFSSCAGDVSSVLFLYRAPLRFRARRCALATPSSAAQGSAPARPPDGDPGARPTARQLPVYLAHVRFPPPPATPLFPFSLKRRPVGRKGSSKCDCH